MADLCYSEYYCHPLYASHMTGYGVDIHAPRMPYVTSTILIKRPFERLWRPSWAFWKIIVESFWTGQGTSDTPRAPVMDTSTDSMKGFAEDEFI